MRSSVCGKGGVFLSYRNKIQETVLSVYKANVGNKIFDGIDSIITKETGENGKRWVFELLQNARDINPKRDVNISVEIIDEQYLDFYHDGEPFTVKAIMSLINQVSGKARDSDLDTVGRFGTGFMTTHLLSKVVEITGEILEEGEELKRFQVVLDRSGDSEEIIKKVDEAYQSLLEIDDRALISDDFKKGYTTRFRYYLKELTIAKEGLEALSLSKAAIKLLNPNIKKIESPEKCESREYQEIPFEYGKILIRKDENGFVRLADDEPKIYCSFPLLGTEDIALPFIIHSNALEPNEPRTGIRGYKFSEINNAVIENALDTYLDYIDTLDGADLKYYELIHLKKNVNIKWWNQDVIQQFWSRLNSKKIILKDYKTSDIFLSEYFEVQDILAKYYDNAAIIPLHKELSEHSYMEVVLLSDNQMEKIITDKRVSTSDKVGLINIFIEKKKRKPKWVINVKGEVVCSTDVYKMKEDIAVIFEDIKNLVGGSCIEDRILNSEISSSFFNEIDTFEVMKILQRAKITLDSHLESAVRILEVLGEEYLGNLKKMVEMFQTSWVNEGREVGEFGERYAFSYLRDKMSMQYGVLSVTRQEVCFANGMTLVVHDRDDYKQGGFDFSICADGKVLCYIEVKSTKSYHKKLTASLSPLQTTYYEKSEVPYTIIGVLGALTNAPKIIEHSKIIYPIFLRDNLKILEEFI